MDRNAWLPPRQKTALLGAGLCTAGGDRCRCLQLSLAHSFAWLLGDSTFLQGSVPLDIRAVHLFVIDF